MALEIERKYLEVDFDSLRQRLRQCEPRAVGHRRRSHCFNRYLYIYFGSYFAASAEEHLVRKGIKYNITTSNSAIDVVLK